MGVGSLAELNLISYAWLLYDNIFALLQFTGIVTFPFLWVLYNNSADAVRKFGITNPQASISAFNATFPTFVIMILIYAVACIPSQPLDLAQLNYTNICTDTQTGTTNQSPPLTPGNTNTTQDLVSPLITGNLQPADAEVPLLWDIIMRTGAGFAQALNSSGACPNKISGLDNDLREMRIEDATLREEVAQFASDCYFPALSRFNTAMQETNLSTVPTVASATNPNQYYAAKYRDWRGSPPPNQQNTEVLNRDHDPNWIGSRFFLETPGLYESVQAGNYSIQGSPLRAKKPVADWPYDPVRDCDHSNSQSGNFCNNAAVNPMYANNEGYPGCKEWWLGDQIRDGLLTKLQEDAEDSQGAVGDMSTKLNDAIVQVQGPGASKSPDWIQDKIVLTTLSNDLVTANSVLEQAIDGASSSAPPPPNVEGNWETSAAIAIADVTAMAAVLAASTQAGAAVATAAAPALIQIGLDAAEFYATAWLIRNAYPIAVAFLLLVMIVMLPFVLVGSTYDLGRLLQIGLLFLAVQFLAPWRFIVEYLDENLFTMMFPDGSMWGFGIISATVERAILDVVTTGMYTVVPVLVLWMAAFAGADDTKGAVNASNAMDGLKGFVKSGGRLGSQAANGATRRALGKKI